MGRISSEIYQSIHEKDKRIGDRMLTIKIGDMKNVPWKKTKATLSIMIQDARVGVIIIKDCRLIDGVNGMYVLFSTNKKAFHCFIFYVFFQPVNKKKELFLIT